MRAALQPRTALVHHWFVTLRGGERVLGELAELYPEADVFTLVCDRQKARSSLGPRPIRTSLLQHLPKATQWYPYYLPLFPMATERMNLSGYSLVITSDAATLKGVRTDRGAIHICYCHTPMRYVWSGYEIYRRASGVLGRAVYPKIAERLRAWDFRAAQGVTHFLANSQNVAEQIRRYYVRESTVIYPPVDTEYFVPAPEPIQGDYYLVVSQLVPYKRVDLAIEAAKRIGTTLVVIGDGTQRSRLENRDCANICFLGWQPDAALRKAIQNCRALVHPGEEDFGIVMAEAQACGRPVIAFARGGAREIVTDGATGILFQEQTVECLCEAIMRCERTLFDPAVIRTCSLRFNRERFVRDFSRFVEHVVSGWPRGSSAPHDVVDPALTQ